MKFPLFVVFVFLLIVSLFSLAFIPRIEVVDKCYDRYSNEIIGASCVDSVSSYQSVEAVLVILAVIFFFMSIIVFIEDKYIIIMVK